MMKKEIIENYEKEAEGYEAARFGTPGGRIINKIELEIVRKLVEPRNKKILDVACGTGRFTIDMFEHGADIIGADAAKNMLRIAKEKTADIKSKKFSKSSSSLESQKALLSKIKFERGDIFNLKYKDRAFDAVTGFKIIMHLYEYKNAIKEMKRVTKNNGFIVFEIPNRLSIWSLLMNMRKKFFYRACHEHKIKKPGFTYSKIKKDLAGLGLRIDMAIGMYYLPETLFRKSPGFFLPIFYRIERFLRIMPARWGRNIYLRVVKCGSK